MDERVALGHDEVDPADLSGGGGAWTEVVPGHVDDRIAGFVRDLLPATGWRELSVAPPSGRRFFAAPHEDGWALAHLAATPDGEILSADPGPFLPRPGKAVRRAGLALDLDPIATAADGIHAVLTNTSDQPWVADPHDNSYCHAWVLDADGDRIGSSAFAFAPLQHQLTDLLPGESRRLPAELGSDAQLNPGVCRIEVVLPSLGLFANGTVEVQ